MSNDTVFVQILDKDYQVACPMDERDALRNAAQSLDERMRDIRGSGAVIGLERIAVMAALNLSYELQEAEENSARTKSNENQLQILDARLSAALDKFA
jgi:cell division protein ZapA